MRLVYKIFIAVAAMLLIAVDGFAQSGARYPYVSAGDNDGPVIVSRDMNGGVKTEALSGADNRIAAGLQVAGEDFNEGTDYSWIDAANACTDGWRLPTKRELQLIWLMGGAESSVYSDNRIEHMGGGSPLHGSFINNFKVLTADSYWSSTADGADHWYVVKNTGETKSGSGLRGVRCVRDYAAMQGSALTYTQEGSSPVIYIAEADANEGAVMSWYDALGDLICPYPYKMPNKNELQLTWVYKGGFENNRLASVNYWTSTIASTAGDIAWYINFNNGSAGTSNSENKPVRCVINNEAVGNVYPFVSDEDAANGPVIVSVDNNGGVKADALLAPANQPLNTIVPKFQVANANAAIGINVDGKYAYVNAVDVCQSMGGDWRLPTQRELQLIWLMGGSVKARYIEYGMHFAGDSPMYDKDIFGSFDTMDETYWSSTPHSSGYVWRVYAGHGYTGPGSVNTAEYCVRCVRDYNN